MQNMQKFALPTLLMLWAIGPSARARRIRTRARSTRMRPGTSGWPHNQQSKQCLQLDRREREEMQKMQELLVNRHEGTTSTALTLKTVTDVVSSAPAFPGPPGSACQ